LKRETARGTDSPYSFIAFFLAWAKLRGWKVPDIHFTICDWLEHCDNPVRVLMVFRGAAKSTIYAVYKAWRLYCDRNCVSIVWAADDHLAKKMTGDTLHVLRTHPLCRGMVSGKQAKKEFRVVGLADGRDASMLAVGVNSNSTGSRCDCADFDDIEVPKNIRTAEARASLRQKIEESTHILRPRGQKTFIGTPHTFNSIYTEQIAGGAAFLKIPLFFHVERYEQTFDVKEFAFPHPVAKDGLYVFSGIGKPARLLRAGIDYRTRREEDGFTVVFSEPPGTLIDIASCCAWPEYFTRDEILFRRRETQTVGGWDSQYQLEATPIGEVRLDPSKMHRYDVEPVFKTIGDKTELWLGNAQIASALAYWDCALGSPDADASAFSLIFVDTKGRIYWHLCEELTGDLVQYENDFSDHEIGGQVVQIRHLCDSYPIPAIEVETNGIGGYVPPVLRAALKGSGVGIRNVQQRGNKQERILEAFEPVLKSGILWCSVGVYDKVAAQMREFNPLSKTQHDDFLDSAAGAMAGQPARIGKIAKIFSSSGGKKDWRPAGGSVTAPFIM
jgi:hypothetical protein